MPANRHDALEDRFNAFLDRYTPPRNLISNETALQDEADTLMTAFLKYAPTDNYQDWADQIFYELALIMKTRAWPSAREISEAASVLQKKMIGNESRRGTPHKFDTDAIMADRIKRGGPVAETYLWGRQAVNLLRKGYVTPAEIQKVRDMYVRSAQATYGDTRTSKMVAHLMELHAKAERIAEAEAHNADT
jgi:hypothetical protein